MPAFINHNASLGIPKIPGPHAGCQPGEVDQYFPERNLQITGTTKDSTGAALGNCDLYLMDNTNKGGVQFGQSDANGVFSLPIACGLSQPQTTTWWILAYKNGTPVAGLTINSLTGA